MSMIENGLATALGFVTKPVGAAVTAVALAGAVGGGLYVKHWWDNVQSLDETVAEQSGQINDLTHDLQQSELNAASARTAFARQLADFQNQVTVSRREASAQRMRAGRLAERLAELQNEETGPLAPVLIHALDSVRDDLRGLTPVA